jgi:hypothetical protein
MEPRRWEHPDLPEWGLCVPRVHGGVVERMLCKGCKRPRSSLTGAFVRLGPDRKRRPYG